MKRILTIVAAVMLTIAATAQKSVATLCHNGVFTLFEGEYSLEQAVEAAVDNDIIYLSEGDFKAGERYQEDLSSIHIDKRVTIQGCGYKSNIKFGLEYTDGIYNEDSLFIENLTLLDGVAVSYVLLCLYDRDDNLFSNMIISKCDIEDTLCTPMFGGLIVEGCNIYGIYGSSDMWGGDKNYVRNSKVGRYFWGGTMVGVGDVFENCHIGYLDDNPLDIINSIVEDVDWEIWYDALYAENSIIGTVCGDVDFEGFLCFLENCWTGYEDLLDDNLECVIDLTGYLGTDGTQIGIYGGEGRPYSVYPSVPFVDTSKSSVVYDSENNQLKVSASVSYYETEDDPLFIGYHRYLNGRNLGYSTLPGDMRGEITLTEDLPDTYSTDLSKTILQFNGDVISYNSDETVNYVIQVESSVGWTPPVGYELEVGGRYSTTAEEMKVPSSIRFAAPGFGEFKAVKFDTDGRPLYVRADRGATLDLYRDGEKVQTVTADELTATKLLDLEAGTYYGVIYNVAYGDGDVTFHLMDTNNQVPTPEIHFDKRSADSGFISMTCSREDAEIHYTIDHANISAESTLYEGEFELTRNAVVRAMAVVPGFDLTPSDVTTLTVDSFTVGEPEIRFDEQNLYVVIIPDAMEGVVTYYTLDGTEPTELDELRYDGNPITLTEDRLIRARSFKEGYNPSKITEFEYSHATYTTLPPVISIKNTTVTITGQTSDSRIYYAVNDSNPDNFSLYEQPFEISGNCTIYAQARMNTMYDSEVAFKVVGDLTCEGVTVAYDGRYVTLECSDGEAEIHYSLDGSNWETYTGSFDAGNVGTLTAYATRDGYNDSEVTEYAINVYSDEEHAVTTVAGVLSSAFGWYPELPGLVESYRVEGPLNEEDFSVVSSMRSMLHLDLEAAVTENIPDNAFQGLPLVSISLPSETDSYGNAIFNGCATLSSVVFNGTVDISEEVMAGADNPNLLLYVVNPGDTEVTLFGARNMVEGDEAEAVTLTDNNPFYAARSFTAKEISYTRNFEKVTEVDGCTGWETLTLPFDVQTVSDSRSAVTPFAAEDEERHFWLYRPADTGWERTATIDAYMPYLIAMPNHQWYAEESTISGTVTFKAQNVTVALTPESTGMPYKDGFDMIANYMPTETSGSIYVINDTDFNGHLPGSVFASGLRDARPFEAYLTGVSSRSYLPVFDSSEVETIMGDDGIRIWCEDKEICIHSGIGVRVRIYDTVGRLVRIADVRAGETCRVADLNKGVYIVGDTKLYVK